ncbi:Beta-galactosidase 5 [Zea mays]|uniref:Beta-galactosidase 5 n=1 Tax=Zea mays TaxID=4577 RepID=A0A1D6PQ27_MAIZE|nr:Beta-galactosidase 5 [Zea mays]AQK48891.1 Beta-galactosidase 5 [Zea mays]
MLSVACGLPNVGVHYETWNTGVGGPVVLHRLDEGSRDLTWQTWSYQVARVLLVLPSAAVQPMLPGV